MKKNKGMILICTLAIMVILSIFLMVTVYRMQSSSLVTKRIMWDIKSYWAAIAGNNVAADSCIDSENFPYSSKIPFNTNTTEYGGYRITVEDEVVKGEDEFSASSFTINYKNNLTGTSNDKSSELSTLLQLHFNTINATKGEIYCLTVGKSGPTVCGTDFIYNINNALNTTFNTAVTNNTLTNEQATFVGAALYVGGNLNVNVKDYFTILQKDGTKGCIVSGGAININSEKNAQPPTWEKSGGLSIGNGSVFAGTSCAINGKDIPLDDKDNFSNYGVSVYQKPAGKINAPTFKTPENQVNCPTGIWCFMEMPSRTEDNNSLSGLKENEFKTLCDVILDICPNNRAETDDDKIKQINIKFYDYLASNNQYANWFQSFEDKFKNKKDGNITTERTEGEKAFIASKFNQVFDKLSNLSGQYIPILITEDSLSTRASLTASSIESIKYSEIMSAMIQGELSENCADEEDRKEINRKIKTKNGSSQSNYIIEDCTYGTNKHLYIFNKFGEKNKNKTEGHLGPHTISNDFTSYTSITKTNALNLLNNGNLVIDENNFNISINGNLHTKNFSFAVLDRNPASFSEAYKQYLQTTGIDTEERQDALDDEDTPAEADEKMYYNGYTNEFIAKLISQQTECYVLSNNHRGAVKLGNETNSDNNSIDARKIHIKGALNGLGNLRSRETDITFEAVGSGVSSEDNLVSMWAADDIKIYQVSAANLSTTTNTSSADFKGILYANDKIRINVGSDNLNFNVSGVVISRTGLMEVNGIKNFTITYDPDISGEILEKYISGWQTITDSLSSSSGSGSNTNNNTNATLPTGTFKAFNRI